MNYPNTTQVPNILFDELIPILKPSEIIVLLIIIRQTIGWYNSKTKKRKERDWISYRQFQKKTNLSKKTISSAIKTLVRCNAIRVTNRAGSPLAKSSERKGKVRIYYTCLLLDKGKSNHTNVKKLLELRQNLPLTKLTLTKETQQKGESKRIRKQTDSERISEILKSYEST